MSFVEFHARSAFSFLEGASLPETLAEFCAERALPAMALLDRDGIYGAPRFHLHAKKCGVKAHIGAEVSLQPSAFTGEEFRLPLIARTRAGYQNLCRMITRAKLRHGTKEEHVALHTEADLEEFASGLVCLTGDEHGPLATALRRGMQNGGRNAALIEGRKCLDRLLGIFGRGNTYVELQRHFTRGEELRNQAAITLAREFNLPLLATNGVRYADPSERQLLDAFTCIRHKRQLETGGRLLTQNAERFVRTPAEMSRIFADLPEAIANTLRLSEQIEFTLEDLGYEFPRYPVPDGHSMMSYLRERTMQGARQRYRPLYDRARRQLERELHLIEKLELAGYFLIVWDIIHYCAQQGILVQGRGSAANSAVCYALGITAVDPVGMDLLFERFLSEERGEWPDIDLDLPSGDERERVIQYVYQRYGTRGAAMTANVITYRGRSAAREMGKVLGFDEDAINRLSGLVGSWEWQDPNDTLDKQFTQAGFDLRHPRIAQFMKLCLAVRDLPRHLGQHSGGMVICQGRLDSVVPLEPASMPGRVVVQWDKDDCADLGIIKVDLLGLGMMAVLKDTITLIRDHYDEEVDLAHLPPDDPVTYETIRKADTVGMFQIESRAQMASLPRNAPTRFYDLVVQVALIRPGPIVGQMTNPYMQRRMGRQAVTYPHPALEPVLERTLGIPLFQEQLLRMSMICANFTGGEAEELRRALGSRRSQKRMHAIEEKLRAGMTANDIDVSTQESIIQFITSFALYGFPESHAASFALIAYASAYLKVHYLGAFTVALINNYPMGFYHPATIIKDAQRHGLKARCVDINVSEWNCTLESRELRLGFRMVRGMRQEVAEAIVRERAIASFISIDDLVRRVPALRKNELTMLAQIGALNALAGSEVLISGEKLQVKGHRRDALWQAAAAAQPNGPLLKPIENEIAPSPLDTMTDHERLVADYHGTGVTVGRHPMSYRRAQLNEIGALRAADLAHAPNGKRVRYAGCVIVRQRPGTARGLIFMSVEDETGIANVIVMPDLYDACKLTVIGARFILVEGVLQNVDNVVHLRAETIEQLPDQHVELVLRYEGSKRQPQRAAPPSTDLYLDSGYLVERKKAKQLSLSDLMESHDFH
jgi:error-prone DNA polymerase